MAFNRVDFREELPANIIKWAGLENTINELFRTFESWEEKNAELVNKFFDQNYFKGEESLIDKLIGINSNTKFNDIEEEWINLALLEYNNRMRDFNDCFKKIRNNDIKKAFMDEIFNKVKNVIWTWAPYDHFDTDCAVPMIGFNVSWYFQKVVDYLNDKEWAGGSAQKTKDILHKINITNKDLNDRLLALGPGRGIPLWTNLADPSIPRDIRDDFDTLLSFEIGKEADRTVNIYKDISNRFQWLLTNTFPAINTIVWESDEYKYDESKLWDEYNNKVQEINNNTTLSEKDKKDQLKSLKWEYYLKYLKSKNAKIGNALEELYNNDFDYSKLDWTTLKNYLHAVANIRLKMLFNNWLNDALKVNFGNLNAFKSFYKNLADPTLPTINLNNVNIPWATPPDPLTWTINIPIQKKIIEWKNEWLKDIDEFWKNAKKSFDTLPIEYTINKSDIEWLDITIEDREKLLRLLSKFDQWENYVIKWEDIWILIYLYFIINNKNPITEIDFEKQKEIEDLFGKADNFRKKTKKNEEWNEWPEPFTPEKFKEKIETYWPGKFEKWSEIWLPMGKSKLPGWWYQWMKIKIKNIDMSNWKFEWTIFWWELKFSRDLEWRTKDFKMNEEFLNTLKEISSKATGKDKICLQPNPNKSDFNSFRDSLNNKLWKDNFIFPPAWSTWNGNKFMQKIVDEDWNSKEEEVKYFWASSDDKSTYKIEYSPIRNCFTVSSTFSWEEKWKDWKNENKRFSYKRDMDWNNFLIFATQKWLTPQTEEEASDTIQRQDQEFKIKNGGTWTLNRFSFNNIKNWLKDIFWTLKKKVDDYDKSQTEKFKGIVESPILNAIGSIPLLPDSIKYALWERQQEIYNEITNGSWKKIEWYLKSLQSDGQFADTFDQVPPHLRLLWWSSYKDFLTNLWKKANHGRLKRDEIHRAAALLLANYEKWGSPFRWLTEYENKWFWVKILLGNDHYKQFLRDKAACTRDRDLAENTKNSWLDKKWLNEQLATCEMDYIINNIRWAYPKLPGSYFPCHENRWIDWDKSTNYIPNPSKRLLSEQFANKLEDAKKWWLTKSSVEDAYNKNKSVNRFEILEDDFWKAWSSRYKQAAWALRRMIDLASDDPLKRRMKKHFLTYLLSWVLDIYCDPWLKKQVYWRAKPMMFVPWLLVKQAWVAENIAILLDDATNWDFSRNVTKYFHKNDQLKWWIDFKGLQWEINKWLTDEKMDQLDKYFSKLPTLDISSYPEPKRSIIAKYQNTMSDSNRDEADRWILENPNVVSNWLLSSVEVVQKRMNIKNWEFNGKDIDEINNMKDFRENVTKDIEWRSTEPKEVAFVLEKFFNRFWIDNQQVYEWIVTANYYKDHSWPLILKYNGIDLNMWNIWKKEIDSILWYAFEWNARKSRWLWCDKLPDELFKTLEAFRIFFSKAFDDWKLLDDYVINKSFKPKNKNIYPSLMWSREVYDQAFAWDWDLYISDSSEDDLFSSDDNKKRKAKKNKIKSLLKSPDFINSDIVNIEKKLKSNLGWTSGLFPILTSSQSRTLREDYFIRRLTA